MKLKLDTKANSSGSLILRDETGKVIHYDKTYWIIPKDHPNRDAKFKELWDNVEKMLQDKSPSAT